MAGSFRDPAGFVFRRDGVLHRQVDQSYREHFDRLQGSGLATQLMEAGLLIPHEVVAPTLACSEGAYKVLRPQPIPFVSYPYEWCFGQLQAAARATMRIQRKALESGLWLKDASAFNIQFAQGRPLLIDTLSFEIRPEGRPWVAYRQFCRHFLAPLALMSYRDPFLAQLFRADLDGIPLELASALLPRRTFLRGSLLFHLHLHARAEKHLAGARAAAARRAVSHHDLLALTDHLTAAVDGLRFRPRGAGWSTYDGRISYSEPALAHKVDLVSEFLVQAGGRTVWDLGGGTGGFARLASRLGRSTVCWDSDPAAVEANYRTCEQTGAKDLLPLVVDLRNPSPALGWAHAERQSLVERGPADVVLALALVHHLVLAAGVPLVEIAQFFAAIGRSLIVEFIPSEDSQVRAMRAGCTEPVAHPYSRDSFEAAFRAHYDIVRAEALRDSGRVLFLMQSRAKPR